VSNDPNSPLGPQVGATLSFTGPLPAGVTAIGEVSVVAQAASAIVDTSIVNFTINPSPIPPRGRSDPVTRHDAEGRAAKRLRGSVPRPSVNPAAMLAFLKSE
jgi:hypothetical protein